MDKIKQIKVISKKLLTLSHKLLNASNINFKFVN